MADVKISGLPASTVPLAGTEVLPIVQGGITKQVSVNNLTAGKAIEGLGLTLTSTDAGASQAPTIDLYRDSASPAAADTIGEVEFNGRDSAGNKQAYALFHGSILSPTSGAEQGQIHFETATAGALTEKMIIGTTNLVINEPGNIFNVRIEGDTDANLFYTDATNSRVGVGTTTPAAKFDVVGGDARINNGNLIIGTSGKGIDFSATAGTGTSELLADYEEGTWTPTITGSTTNPTVTYGLQRAIYTKVGRLVTVTCFISWTAISGGSGDVRLSGLPFTIEASPAAAGAGAISEFNGYTAPAGRTFSAMYASSGTTYLNIRALGSAVSTQALDITNLSASGSLNFTVTYST